MAGKTVPIDVHVAHDRCIVWYGRRGSVIGESVAGRELLNCRAQSTPYPASSAAANTSLLALLMSADGTAPPLNSKRIATSISSPVSRQKRHLFFIRLLNGSVSRRWLDAFAICVTVPR